jgi:hypothetical protein
MLRLQDAAEGTILLKNDNTLPFNSKKSPLAVLELLL